jgi:hypothetical protein
MATSTTSVTSLDGFHATPTAQRADELVRTFFGAGRIEVPGGDLYQLGGNDELADLDQARAMLGEVPA